MSIAGWLFVWMMACIGFVVGTGAIDEEKPPGHHFAAGIVTSILFAVLAIQIIN